ncbi:MAG: hypothetical protein E6K94_00830 [Thaumarchaeota archaeon]|nr:MAG: hypothetical protein E6L03_07270 [Nitrososphaerota archaeon]TLX84328.1 MAG: hypothetical protein E6L01_07695 [Nitrososphaerota archaeon]TLX91816.1 MAG: hypothetical protein E6K94_00830 [Nitrososphaerota archaeon]
MIVKSSKSPLWVRGLQIGLGALTVILSIFALAFPAYTLLSIIVFLSIILLFVGIEKIITGFFLPSKPRWTTIGFGILVLIFAGLAISYPNAAALIVTTFIGIGLLFNGIARIVEGIAGNHYGWAKLFLIAVGILAVIISIMVLISPLFGAILVGTIIAIALLITGIQMIAMGLARRGLQFPQTDTLSK